MASRIGPSNFFLTFSGGFPNIGKPEALRVASTYSARKQKLNSNASAGGTTPTPESELSWPRQDLDFPDKFAIEYEQKMEEIRQVLQSKGEDDACECLVLVDAIQRVGLSSYYEQEIETILRKLYVSSCSCMYGYYNLHDVSPFSVYCDNMDTAYLQDGRFRRNLSQDIRGLVELYEAAQLSVEGEHILDEAASFSSHLLRECLPVLED
ncbi:Tricyclene synthase Oc15, chloroplastic [Sesamum angolense]|uniref:Tricyclene synthase Oc15, chloroplastic n=1 Tax=Sesamum angolense TaxID=2727404 RepID=A0AAE2BVL8_9LAMI|nr:Tricyclene synthase Oc15, chloroplastic [Sesamum angolense]